MNPHIKISIPLGAAKYLEETVEKLRREVDLLRTEVQVSRNFFSLIDRLEGKKRIGYEEDQFWQAKKDIQEAIDVQKELDTVKDKWEIDE